MEKKKVTRKDLPVQKGKLDIDFIEVDGRKINLTPVPHQSIEQFITHDDCVDCGNQFEKHFTYAKRCESCTWIEKRKKYEALELVEWDARTPLCIYDDDTYFFDADDIISYCENHDIKPSDLMLVLCETTNFSTIDFDQWCDEVHEDWEPSSEFSKRLEEFNEFLQNESTNTWWASNKRVDVSYLDRGIALPIDGKEVETLTCGYCDSEFAKGTGGNYGEYGDVCINCYEGLS